MSNTREELIEVYESVRKDMDSGFYEFFGKKVELSSWSLVNYSSRDFLTQELLPDDRLYDDFPNPRIYVQNRDFLDVAVSMSLGDWQATAALNPSSASTSGGGVRKGSRALEEIICRRSNLLKSLELFADPISGKYISPLRHNEVIWSPEVYVYRDSDYNVIESPQKINIISGAAINRPRLDGNNNFVPSEEKNMKERMRAVFREAILHGVVKLILPAWGCGAFGCPAKEVARMFDEVLHEREFWGAFEEICFAILDDHNAKRESNIEGNYKPFLDRFGE